MKSLTLLLVFFLCLNCQRESLDCPFSLLSVSKVEYQENDKSTLFASEFEASANAIKKEVVEGKVKMKSSLELKDVIEEYEETVFAGDSLFVSYYNGLVNNICMMWMIYKDDQQSINRDNLQTSIEDIQEFVKNYHVLGMKEDYESLNESGELLRRIKMAISFLEENKNSEVARMSEYGIRWRNYHEKLLYLETRLENIDTLYLNRSNLVFINDAKKSYFQLRGEIETLMNKKLSENE